MNKCIAGIGVSLFLTMVSACSDDPAHWALAAESELKCGMSLDESQSIIGNNVVSLSGVRGGWMTHFSQKDSTDLWLGFDTDGLRWVQVAKRLRWSTAVEEREKVDLCASVFP